MEMLRYSIFGTLAAIINIVCYQVFSVLMGEHLYLFTNVLSWIITVIFAFVANKLWVFQSKSWEKDTVEPEIIGFLIARLFSLVIEEAGLYLLIDILNFKTIDWSILGINLPGILIAKIIIQVLVIVSNYIFSKFVIFSNNKK